ncbi:MAG TPA: dephospho-CoA kinase [Syntrophothermus lipocalidus]|nr:dephospho-CoA kinase [Syntrophothermus lipocalidus]
MRVIGLTGGIASGKSTVSYILKSLGAVIIDADKVARKVVEPGQPAWQDIVKEFGQQVLNEDMTINREVLGKLVFSDQSLLAKLNRITHPRVIEYFREELARMARENPEAVVVLDVPLLFESGMYRLADEIWVVWANEKVQLERLMEREGFTPEEAWQRIRAQMPLEEKARRADRVINNSGTLDETVEQTTRFFYETISAHDDKIKEKKR